MTDLTTKVEPTPGTVDHALQGCAEMVLRAHAYPLSVNHGWFGWQMIAGRTAALAARAMHALNEAAPEKAAEIARWDAGWLDEGIDPVVAQKWVEDHVLEPAGIDVDEARAQATDQAIAAATAKAA